MYLGMKNYSFPEMVIAFVAGTFFGAMLALLLYATPTEAGVTMNYRDKTVQTVLYPVNEHGDVTSEPYSALFACPGGWKWEVYVWEADLEHPPAFVPVLLDKGECDAANAR